MRKLALILLALIFPLRPQSGGVNAFHHYQAKSEFAVTICPGPNNTLLNYAIVVKNNGRIVKSTPLTEQSFMMQITGRMSSQANPKLKNILKEKVLDTCDCVMDDLWNKYLGYNCVPFDELWKVRYKYDPRFHNMKELPEFQGWAKENYSPGEKQVAYVFDRYHIKSLNDFIVGDDLYLLLNDVQDSSWIDNYSILDN